MQASHVTRETLEAAADTIGVRVEIDTHNAAGTRHRVKLYPIVPPEAWQVDRSRARRCPACGATSRIVGEAKDGRLIGDCGDALPPEQWAGYRRWKDERGDSKYQRTSAAVMFHEGRRVHAVCWHGFRDYFREVFKRQPDAVFRTALDTWRGAEDFEARYRESGHRNVGTRIAPMCPAEVCRCGEEGWAR